MLNDIFPLLFLIGVYYCIGLLFVTATEKETESKKIIKCIFNSSFLIYFLYFFICYLTHYEDAFSKYPITFWDSTTFYSFAGDIAQLTLPEAISEVFTEHKYSDMPGAVLILGQQLRFFRFLFNLTVSGELYGLISGVYFCAVMIPVFMGKTLKELKLLDQQRKREIMYFTLFSFLLYYSSFLLRDVQIMLLYTILMYLLYKQKCILRYLYVTVIISLLFLFRAESGLFALAFVFVYIYRTYSIAFSGLLKIVILFFFICLGTFLLYVVYDQMFDTLQRYNDRSLGAASADSFGAKIATKTPFPFNYILLTAFSQILPFPIYHFASVAHTNYLIHSVTIFTPFYWLYIMYVALVNYFKSQEKKIICGYFFLVSLLFLFLTSIAEFNPRRQMAVYPFIFVSYIYYSKTVPSSVKLKNFLLTTTVIIVLHLLYYTLKLI